MGGSKKPDTGASFAKLVARDSTHSYSVGVGVVHTTRERIETVLLRNEKAWRAQRDWLAPLGVLVSLIATLVAADFRDALSLPKAVWNAAFVLAAIFFTIQLVSASVNAIRLRKVATIDSLLEQICADKSTGSGESQVGDGTQDATQDDGAST